MANPTCTQASFISGAACYFNFNAQDRAALLIYLNSLELAAIGGTAYTLGSSGTLSAASVCYRQLENNTFQAPSPYVLFINANNATSAGASVPATNTLLASAIACLKNFPEQDLAAMQLQLTCALGRHKAYPQ